MNVFLYELLEDYQFAETEAEREEIFCSFCRLLWDNPFAAATLPLSQKAGILPA